MQFTHYEFGVIEEDGPMRALMITSRGMVESRQLIRTATPDLLHQ